MKCKGNFHNICVICGRLIYGFPLIALIFADIGLSNAIIIDASNTHVNQGMDLVRKALDLKPEYYGFLHTQGWGLYKQEKYVEASEVLQRSWDLRMKHAVYDHEASLHLEAAKKAVAGMKGN